MANTIKDMLVETVGKYAGETALQYKVGKEWQTISYGELMQRVRQVSELLYIAGVQPGDRVALWRDNDPEWCEIYLGIVGLGAVAVPVDAKLRPKEAIHIFNDSGAKILFSSAKEYKALKEIEWKLDALEMVILKDHSLAEPQDTKLHFLDYEAKKAEVAEAAGQDACAFTLNDPAPDDLASLIYTSGTTGRPKGAMLSHGNFMCNVNDAQQVLTFTPEDNFLLVLPLHHAFAFTGCFMLPIGVGATISFVQNLRTVGENIREVQPTFLMAVPLLLEKMYTKLQDGLKANKVAWFMYNFGLRKVIAKKIHQKLGGKLRLIVSGAAPLDPEIIYGFQALGIKVLEGYGLTETAPVLTINLPGKIRPGTVGLPLGKTEIVIRDPNEEGVGEITARGANIMKGYYHNDEATAEVFDDGWFLTGDLGLIDKEGFVHITGRKKSLIVNREGKNIYPEEVEMVINQSPFVLESLALGYQEADDKVGERVGIIVVPDLEQIAKDKPGLTDNEIRDLVKVAVKAQAEDLSQSQRPRRIQIRFEEFEKTSTQKIKRYMYEIELEEL
jgi:long-chain acyl-CoA synthetase